MEAIALIITCIVSAVIFIGSVAYWQYAVTFLTCLGLPQDAAVFGPISTVMLIGLIIDYYRNRRSEKTHGN